MNEVLRLFENSSFGNVRVLLDSDKEPWFVGNDVARCLGYVNPKDAVKRLVDKDDSMIIQLADNQGGCDSRPHVNQQVTEIRVINESGLYSLILSSKLESAREFKRWVTKEVLPAIRKTGTYIKDVAVPDFSDPAKAARAWADAYEAKMRAEREKLALERQKKMADDIIKEQTPKVEFANTAIMARAGDDMLIRDVRKRLESHGYDIAERSLREFLQEQRFFFKNSRNWVLNQNVIDKGYAHYRYNEDAPGTNTVYITELGFQKIVHTLSMPEWRRRFQDYGGKIT